MLYANAGQAQHLTLLHSKWPNFYGILDVMSVLELQVFFVLFF